MGTKYGGLDVFSLSRVGQKLKAFRRRFNKAVDTGRRSGGARIVATFYEELFELFARNLPLTSIPTGIETINLPNPEAGETIQISEDRAQDNLAQELHEQSSCTLNDLMIGENNRKYTKEIPKNREIAALPAKI